MAPLNAPMLSQVAAHRSTYISIFQLFCLLEQSLCKQVDITILNYFETTRNILFIDVSASRRKPSSGLTSSVGRQYVKACPMRGLVGSCPHLDSRSPSS